MLVSENITKIIKSFSLAGKGRMVRFDIVSDSNGSYAIITVSGAFQGEYQFNLRIARNIWRILVNQEGYEKL